MCASVIVSGSRGISKLHVCVDNSFDPSGIMICIGFWAGCLFIAGAPSTKKCPVAPESEMAHWTALVILFVSSDIAACGNCVKLLA